jgi:SpoVK/Ycf46/Vps4 family AAA+-type ATPase
MRDKDSGKIGQFLFDISKIVEGAANGDYEKVLAYAGQLGDRLKAAGEKEAAKRINEILNRSKAKKLSLARATPGNESSPATPVDSESRMPTADVEYWDVGQVPLYLPEDTRKDVDRFLQYLRAADRLIASGVGISPSMLIYGPPGCGKTQLARFIASELKLPLVTARTDGLISSYLGSTAKNLRALFEHAASRPCVLFLDEFDALAKMRDDGRELGELKRVVISLLQNIDALGRDHVLLAATNHEHLLDPAIWRRFAFTQRISEPDEAARILMLRHFLRGYADEESIKLLAAMTDRLSGAALRQLAEDAVRDAVLSEAKVISLPQLAESLLALTGARQENFSSLATADKIKLIKARNPDKLRQRELARIFDISQPRVSQILREQEVFNG